MYKDSIADCHISAMTESMQNAALQCRARQVCSAISPISPHQPSVFGETMCGYGLIVKLTLSPVQAVANMCQQQALYAGHQMHKFNLKDVSLGTQCYASLQHSSR